jgi:hypothetical protein
MSATGLHAAPSTKVELCELFRVLAMASARLLRFIVLRFYCSFCVGGIFMAGHAQMPDELCFLTKAGELGQLVRSYDWKSSGLGPAEDWPPGLKAALRIVLSTRRPMAIFWGPEHIFFYNDAYRRWLSPEKHPRGRGCLSPTGER